MITDSETDLLFVADCLQKKYPKFFIDFENELSKYKVPLNFLPGCKDIWAVDFMPVQTGDNKFVQFVYNPDYLQDAKWKKTISDGVSICKSLDVNPTVSDIVIDGGNVIRGKSHVIMCDKVFAENPNYSKTELIEELCKVFEIDNLVIIPTHPDDIFGHADGMVRFLDEQTVLINTIIQGEEEFEAQLRANLSMAGLDVLELPYYPALNKKSIGARGFYINYLQMEGLVVVPLFNCAYDEYAVAEFEKIFSACQIATVQSNDVADQGGVLNCLTWNIKSSGVYNIIH